MDGLPGIPLHNSSIYFSQEQAFVISMSYGPTAFFAKLSLFWLYLRLFRPDYWTRILIYFGICITFVFYTATTVAGGVLCIPRSEESWAEVAFTRCQKNVITGFYLGIFNVVSDLYILILPIPVIWQLQMPTRKKIGVCAIFMTGIL